MVGCPKAPVADSKAYRKLKHTVPMATCHKTVIVALHTHYNHQRSSPFGWTAKKRD